MSVGGAELKEHYIPSRGGIGRFQMRSAVGGGKLPTEGSSTDEDASLRGEVLGRAGTASSAGWAEGMGWDETEYRHMCGDLIGHVGR